MSVYFTVSRDSVSFPGERAYLHNGMFYPEQSLCAPADEFPTLQQATEAVANLPTWEPLEGLRIERHERAPRPAIEILEDLVAVIEDFQDQGYSSLPINALVAEATDRVNQGDD